MACAYAEHHALGFDPTITLVKSPEGRTQYDITVCSGTSEWRVFRTVDVLFDAGSHCVVGRGTRVWKVREVDSATGDMVGEPLVLKDAWVDKHREREGNINARIRESASTLSAADRAQLDKILLTVLCHGDVVVAGAPDRTIATLDARSPTAEHGTAAPSDRDQAHYRIVFREVCIPLSEELALSTVFGALADVCEGESHRDSTCHFVLTRVIRSVPAASLRMGARRC